MRDILKLRVLKEKLRSLSEKAADACRTFTENTAEKAKDFGGKTVRFLKSKKGIVCVSCVGGVLVLAAACAGGYTYWLGLQPKFHDLTVELGTEAVSIRDFMTEYARSGSAVFVTDTAEVNLNQTGQTSLTLAYNGHEETVTLTVQDTVAPTASFSDYYIVMIDVGLPEAADLVGNIEDADEVSVYFRSEPVIPLNYGEETVTVIVEDASGNCVEGDCTLSFRWIPDNIVLELGQTLTKETVLLNPGRDDSLIDQSVLDEINAGGVGEYTITSATADAELTCTVTVRDTTGPELLLKEVQRLVGKTATVDDFVESVSDISGVSDVRLVSEFDVNTEGTYTVTIEAEDTNGNVTRAETTLYVTEDTTPPVIGGNLSAMTVAKHSSPDFLTGVTATDEKDGTCKVTCDASAVDLTKAGTYYVTYSASDQSGNVATARRKVTVEHDAEDTAALVQSIADSLSNDPEAIRDYVRSNIGYNHNWGGDDPVWYGFTTRGGNCYVHANCLKAIFDLKGIESQLIWVTDKSHYWLIVKIDGEWKHIDPTPSTLHGKYSLMNDEQRLSTLSGRVWDTTLWPACN